MSTRKAAPPKTTAAKKATSRSATLKQPEKCLLRLYVAGTTQQSTRAILNIQQICEEHLEGAYQLEVIDIYQRPQLAKDEQIVAVPTLVKKLPEPLRRVIGSFSDSERVLVGLDLRTNGTK
jgi:circadian clock protein KaiB